MSFRKMMFAVFSGYIRPERKNVKGSGKRFPENFSANGSKKGKRGLDGEEKSEYIPRKIQQKEPIR